MNQPIRLISKQGQNKIYLLNGTQTKLERSTITCQYLGMDYEGKPRWAGNRKLRREHLQKRNRNTTFGKSVMYQQAVIDKNGKLKVIKHLFPTVK